MAQTPSSTHFLADGSRREGSCGTSDLGLVSDRGREWVRMRIIHSEQQDTFQPFLRQRPDIRNMIYRLILPSEPIKPRSDSRIWKPRFFDLFLVNRQIYSEASHVLYSKGRFLISVGPDKIFFLRHGTLWGSLLEGYFHVPHESLARRIHNVVILGIEIYGLSVTLDRRVKAWTF